MQEEQKQQKPKKFTLPSPIIQAINPQYNGQMDFSALLPSDGFVNRYDPQGKYIMVGCFGGEKLLYCLKTKKFISQVKCSNSEEQVCTTCIRWRPIIQNTGQVQNRKLLAIGNTDGILQFLHVPTLKTIFKIQQPDNSIHCCDFNNKGQYIATAGKDCNVRVYDEETKSISRIYSKAQWSCPGHSNRIFSLKFINTENQSELLVSGGWDSVIHFWDLRQAKSVQSFYGPHIAGDSIDYRDNKILTGCYSSKSQLQFWDIRNLKKVEEINWPHGEYGQIPYVYTTGFGHVDKSEVIAGSCGVNEVRIFSGTNKYMTSLRIHQINGCFSVDSSWTAKQICFSTSKKSFYIINYGNKK